MRLYRAICRRARPGEEGVAMMIAVVLSAVILTLAVTSLSVGEHSDTSAARGRHWVQALHVAESGVERAIRKIEEASGAALATSCDSGASVTSCSFTGSIEEGDYSVTITRSSRNNYTIESTGGVRAGRRLGAERALRVTMAPPPVFEHALFSFTTVQTKNNDVITGDVWANENVLLAANTTVTGGVTAATGYVVLESGTLVTESVTAGGYDASTNYSIFLDQNSRIKGNDDSKVVVPPGGNGCGGALNANYKVRLETGSVIEGNSSTWGQHEGPGNVLGTTNNFYCQTAPPTETMPSFSYSPSNYDPAALHEYGQPGAPSSTAVTEFQTYLTSVGKEISGTFYINQSSPVGQSNRVDLTGVEIQGDTTIISNTPIFANGMTDDPAITDAVVLLASTYQPPPATSCDVNQDSSECSLHVKNNMEVTGDTAVLVYAPYGPVAMKNNAAAFGAVYADSIEIKNNQALTYDARIQRVVGFGPVTLDLVRWLEVPTS